MPDSNLADGSVLTSSFYNTYIREQVTTTCTSATRPTGVEGRMIYETDTDRLLVYSGTAWVIVTEPAQSWTPSLLGQGVSVSFTVTRGWSKRSYGTWEARAVLAITSAGSGGNKITLTTPYTMPNAYDIAGYLVGTDVGTTDYWATARAESTTQCQFSTPGSGNWLGVSPAWTLASGDGIEVALWGRH